MRYRHRQINLVAVGMIIAAAFFNLFLFFAPESFFQEFLLFDKLYKTATGSWEIYAIIIAITIFIIVLNFSSMVTEINNKTFRWFFGFGLPYRTIQLVDIRQITVVRNRWWYGWGIRQIKTGWLYNVAGLDAIEINLESGKIIRIGSNDVKSLAKKLEKAVSKAASKRSNYNG